VGRSGRIERVEWIAPVAVIVSPSTERMRRFVLACVSELTFHTKSSPRSLRIDFGCGVISPVVVSFSHS
jgi:hypothetical protein